jgi:multiple sugar transport system ATP-binding protein
MGSITLRKVTKKFKNTTAVDNLSLEIRDGEFFCVLGPPGAGKTTLLRLIVGLERPDTGEVRIDGAVMTGVHPSKRDIAMIFQNLALYPDKTVYENIAFPLRQQDIEEKKIDERVRAVAKQLKIDWLLEKLPSQLSGGERQRVAIGRAIVRQPKAYLMDEPLSNLDALLRLEMRVSLKELQTGLRETFVYVTHDQVEALSMGDRIAVLDRGVIQQIGEPAAIYRSPNNMFVATILGNPPMNFLKCAFSEESPGTLSAKHSSFAVALRKEELGAALASALKAEEVILGARPEDVKIHLQMPSSDAAYAFIDAEIYVTEPLGNETIVDIKVGEAVIKVLAESDFSGQPGQKVWIRMNEHKLHFFDAASHQCLHHTSERDEIDIRPA